MAPFPGAKPGSRDSLPASHWNQMLRAHEEKIVQVVALQECGFQSRPACVQQHHADLDGFCWGMMARKVNAERTVFVAQR